MEILKYLFIGLFVASGIAFGFSIAYVGHSKNQLNHAFKNFEKGEKVRFPESGLGIFNPFILFFLVIPLPKYNQHKSFYEIKAVKDKYAEFKSTLKIAVFSFIGISVATIGILSSVYLLP